MKTNMMIFAALLLTQGAVTLPKDTYANNQKKKQAKKEFLTTLKENATAILGSTALVATIAYLIYAKKYKAVADLAKNTDTKQTENTVTTGTQVNPITTTEVKTDITTENKTETTGTVETKTTENIVTTTDNKIQVIETGTNNEPVTTK